MASNNPGGRPLKFKTPEELQEKINQFYKYVEFNEVPMTIERLCCFLECDRKTIINYENKDEFFHTIKEVRNNINAQKVENAITGKTNTAFAIFDLVNNADYVNRQDSHNTNNNVNSNFDEPSAEKLKKAQEIINEIRKS